MSEEPKTGTIFEQDGVVYCALSHSMPAKDLAKETAREIRYMAKIPRAVMRTATVGEIRKMKFGGPKKDTLKVAGEVNGQKVIMDFCQIPIEEIKQASTSSAAPINVEKKGE